MMACEKIPDGLFLLSPFSFLNLILVYIREEVVIA